MKYLRKHNVNPFNLLDDTILQRSDGNIDLNPTQRVKTTQYQNTQNNRTIIWIPNN